MVEYDKSGQLTVAQSVELAGKLDEVLFKHFAPEDKNYKHGYEYDSWTYVSYDGFTGTYIYGVHASRNKRHYPEFFPKTDCARPFRNDLKELLLREGYQLLRIHSVGVGCFAGIKFKRLPKEGIAHYQRRELPYDYSL